MHLDHLVVGCTDLEQGTAWLADQLDAAPSGGGEHTGYGTHNRLWRLDGDRYLELIALQSGVPRQHTPMFGLSEAAVQARLADRPRLLSWVVCVAIGSADSEAVVPDIPDLMEPVSVQRGDFRWRLAVAKNGGLIDSGVLPYCIWWERPHPTEALEDSAWALDELALQTPDLTVASALLQGMPSDPITLTTGSPALSATLVSANGRVVLD